MLKQIEEILEKDRQLVYSIAKTDKDIFSFCRDPNCINKMSVKYDETGLNFIMKGVLFAGLKHKITQVDRNAKIRKVG